MLAKQQQQEAETLTVPVMSETKNYSEALRGLTSTVFLNSEKYREQQWRAVRKGAHPDILDFERLFIRKMKKLNIPVFAHNMVRTEAEQNELYVRGVTKAQGGDSPHNHGMAVDLIHGLFAWDITKHAWEAFGHIGKEIASQNGIDVVWGGDWNFWDPAHWELRDWRQRLR